MCGCRFQPGLSGWVMARETGTTLGADPGEPGKVAGSTKPTDQLPKTPWVSCAQAIMSVRISLSKNSTRKVGRIWWFVGSTTGRTFSAREAEAPKNER